MAQKWEFRAFAPIEGDELPPIEGWEGVAPREWDHPNGASESGLVGGSRAVWAWWVGGHSLAGARLVGVWATPQEVEAKMGELIPLLWGDDPLAEGNEDPSDEALLAAGFEPPVWLDTLPGGHN